MTDTVLIANETVLIALISAGSAVVGALFGAVAAVLGPWWLKKLEIKSERETSYIETRRIAIVKYAHCKTDSIQQYYQSIFSNDNNENLAAKFNEANKSVTELYSLINKNDARVKNWINQMGFKAFKLKPSDAEELCRADAFLGIGIQHLLSWHTGEITTQELRPFGLDESGNSIWLKSWDHPWPE